MNHLELRQDRLLGLFDVHCGRVESLPQAAELQEPNAFIRSRIAHCDSLDALQVIANAVGDLVASVAQYAGVRG